MSSTQRIDKWLWHARFARTRTAAQRLAISGQIRVNRVKNGNASRAVRVGDVLTVASDAGVRILRISGIADRRGSAADVRQLYDDLAPQSPSPSVDARTPPTRVPRPSVRDRRALADLKRTGATR
ncbi:MAG: RNA-binding S4 domain-containing protein [Alphaproteobacteria bacterium]